jgi:hypothetical protein
VREIEIQIGLDGTAAAAAVGADADVLANSGSRRTWRDSRYPAGNSVAVSPNRWEP